MTTPLQRVSRFFSALCGMHQCEFTREGVPRNGRRFPIFVSTSPTAVAITILRVLITVLAHLPRNEFRRGLEGRWLRNL